MHTYNSDDSPSECRGRTTLFLYVPHGRRIEADVRTNGDGGYFLEFGSKRHQVTISFASGAALSDFAITVMDLLQDVELSPETH